MLTWPRDLRSKDVKTVLETLYRFEINCGMESFWDGGWDVWLGDSLNGMSKVNVQSVDVAIEWLIDEVERIYPKLLEDAA